MVNMKLTNFSASRILIIFVIFWFIVLFFIGGSLLKKTDDYETILSRSVTEDDLILARLSRASQELKSLKYQNDELKRMVDSFIPAKFRVGTLVTSSGSDASSSNTSPFHSSLSGPLDSLYESSLRKVGTDLNELWFFLRKKGLDDKSMSFVTEIRHSILSDVKRISARDDPSRSQGLNHLSDQVQSVLHRLQNPLSCPKSNKVLCYLNKGCGFGCQIHHVVYCFVVGLAENRTVILNGRNWRYVDPDHKKSKTAGWNLVFKPVSDTCQEDSGSPRTNWKSGHESAQVLELPIIDSMRPRAEFLPLTIPSQLRDELGKLHGNPSAWFLGQILRYIMRPSSDMDQYVADAKYRIQFTPPMVGIHIRRTDKVGTEAAFHPLNEYMEFAEDFFRRKEMEILRETGKETKLERKIYLATDDPGIWTKEVPEFEEKGYVFVGDSDFAQTAGIGTRYTIESLKNIILDITLLSETDHLVCTFSSQVCRVAYELMQTRKVNGSSIDWSAHYTSLDDIYYYGGQSEHHQEVIISHVPADEEELELKVGDTVGIAGNHWNGLSKGLNKRLEKSGLYPGYKTKEKIKSIHFKAFDRTHR